VTGCDLASVIASSSLLADLRAAAADLESAAMAASAAISWDWLEA